MGFCMGNIKNFPYLSQLHSLLVIFDYKQSFLWNIIHKYHLKNIMIQLYINFVKKLKSLYIYQNALNFLYYFNKKRRMIKLNKKLGYIFVVLVLGLFFISACEQGGIGAKPARQLERGNGEVGGG